MKPAFVRRGSLLDGIPKQELTQDLVDKHDELLESWDFMWDAVLPEEAADFTTYDFKRIPGYIIVSVLTLEKAKEIAAYWNDCVKRALEGAENDS